MRYLAVSSPSFSYTRALVHDIQLVYADVLDVFLPNAF